MTARELWARTFGRLGRNRIEDELEEEMAAHVEHAVEENLRRGMTPEQARRAAALRFGSIEDAKERARDQLGLPAVDTTLRDFRHAVRALRRAPGFTLVAVATLALGIGICSAFFSILNGVLLEPAPGIADPDRLFATQQTISYPHFESLRAQTDLAAGMSAWIGNATFSVALEAGSGVRPERVNGHIVAPGYFRTLGVEPLLGQSLDDLEGEPELGRTVFVSHDFWRTRLGADPAWIGRRLSVNGQTVTVAGVGPPGFLGVFPSSPAQMFSPAAAGPDLAPELDAGLSDPNIRNFRALVRLEPGKTLRAAQAALETRLNGLDAELGTDRSPLESERQRIQLLPAGIAVSLPARMKAGAIALYAVLIGLVLSLTCASLAGLVMARGGSRAKEVAIRLSLGASRGHVVRHLLAESAVLAMAGGVAGLAAAYLMIQALTGYVNGAPGSSSALSPDLGVALLTFAIAALAGAGFGLLPALGSTRPDLIPALKGDASAGLPRLRRFGLRNLFVVAQVAVSLSLILVVGALTLGSSRSAGQDPGFDTAALHVFSIDPRRDGFSPAESARMPGRVVEELMTVPGVESATFAEAAPLALGIRREPVAVPAQDGREAVTGAAQLRAVGPGHFDALGASIVLGEGFAGRPEQSEGEDVTPAIVNRTAAETLFGDGNPVGAVVHMGERMMEIVGVVRYGAPAPFSSEPPPTLFTPMPADELDGEATIVVRSPRGLDAENIQRAVQAADPRLSWFRASTLDARLSELERARQSATAMNLAMGGFALVLACVGLAGVTAQAVERRRREIGIEMALGASWVRVVRGVMKEGATMILCGLLLGWAVAFGLSRALIAANAQFAQMIPAGADVWWLAAGMPLTLAALALAACYWPARRAAAVDPLAVLKAQ